MLVIWSLCPLLLIFLAECGDSFYVLDYCKDLLLYHFCWKQRNRNYVIFASCYIYLYFAVEFVKFYCRICLFSPSFLKDGVKLHLCSIGLRVHFRNWYRTILRSIPRHFMHRLTLFGTLYCGIGCSGELELHLYLENSACNLFSSLLSWLFITS